MNTLFQTCLIISSLVQTNVKGIVYMPSLGRIVASKKNTYPIWDQNDQNRYPIPDQNG